MDLKEAMALFPPDGTLELLTQETYERVREGGQVCADAVRKLAEEEYKLLKKILVMRVNAVPGDGATGYSLIWNDDLNDLADLAARLLLRPGSIPRLPSFRPPDGGA